VREKENIVQVEGSWNHSPSRDCPSAIDIANWLTRRIAEQMNVDPSTIDRSQPFDSLGLDSLTAVVLTGELEEWLSVSVSPTVVWDYPDVDSLAGYLAGLAEARVAAAKSG